MKIIPIEFAQLLALLAIALGLAAGWITNDTPTPITNQTPIQGTNKTHIENTNYTIVWSTTNKVPTFSDLLSPDKRFLIVTNRPYVQFRDGSYLICVTETEWCAITNHFPDRIVTNDITFYGK